jgi:hypothetical protein
MMREWSVVSDCIYSRRLVLDQLGLNLEQIANTGLVWLDYSPWLARILCN